MGTVNLALCFLAPQVDAPASLSLGKWQIFRASQGISADISPGKELDWILPCESVVRVTFTSVQWPRRSHRPSRDRLCSAELEIAGDPCTALGPVHSAAVCPSRLSSHPGLRGRGSRHRVWGMEGRVRGSSSEPLKLWSPESGVQGWVLSL